MFTPHHWHKKVKFPWALNFIFLMSYVHLGPTWFECMCTLYITIICWMTQSSITINNVTVHQGIIGNTNLTNVCQWCGRLKQLTYMYFKEMQSKSNRYLLSAQWMDTKTLLKGRADRCSSISIHLPTMYPVRKHVNLSKTQVGLLLYQTNWYISINKGFMNCTNFFKLRV